MANTKGRPSPPIIPGHAADSMMLDHVTLRPSSDVQGASMDGETVLLNLNTGQYYTLNRLGSVIWELCNGRNTISDIHAVLCDRFDVAPERALDDLVALANHLVQEGLLLQNVGEEGDGKGKGGASGDEQSCCR